MTRTDDIEATAAAFLARREAGGESEEQAAELERWLDESLAHRVAFLRLAHAWEQIEALPLQAPTRATSSRRWWIAAAIAAGVMIAIGALSIFELTKAPAAPILAYSTAVGGRAGIKLADGSDLNLNTDTRLRARIGARLREIWLDQGEFYVDVSHDPARPFVVYAAGRAIRALGTQFSVRREADLLQVIVAEGAVGVSAAEGAQPTVKIQLGDDLVWSSKGLHVLKRSASEVANELAWRDGVLVFQQTPLSEAVAQFNRYNARKLVLADPQAATAAIGGSFACTNVDGFARLLQSSFGLTVSYEGERIIITR